MSSKTSLPAVAFILPALLVGIAVTVLTLFFFGAFDSPEEKSRPEPVEVVDVNEDGPGYMWERVLEYKGKPLHCIQSYHSEIECDFVSYNKENG